MENVNAGDENSNAPANLRLTPEDQFRTLSKRVEDLTAEIGRMSRPPSIRGMDVVQIIIIVMGFVVAIISGFGLDMRISDLRADVAAVEQRLTATLKDTEARLSFKLDKVADQATAIGEPVSRIEGAKGPASK